MAMLLPSECDLSSRRRELCSELEEVSARIRESVDIAQFRTLERDLSRHEGALDGLCESLAGHESRCRELAASLAALIGRMEAKLEEKVALQEQRERLHLLLRLAQTQLHLEQLLDGVSAVAVRADGVQQEVQTAQTLTNLDEILRAARAMGLLRLLRQRGAEQHLKAVQLSTEAWELVQRRLLSRLTASLRSALEAQDEESVVRTICGFVDAGSMAEAEQWIRLEWIAPRLTQRLRAVAQAGEREAFAKICKIILDFAHGPEFAPLLSPRLLAIRPPLHLLASTLWLECNRILKALPNVFGSLAGIPPAFHAAYIAAIQMQEELEGMLPTVAERQYLQCHPATADLMRRFNLPIYFQLRVQEFARALEASLTAMEIAVHLQPAEASEGSPSSLAVPSAPTRLRTAAAVTLVRCVQCCFAPDVFLRPLCSRFFRLAILLILRFNSWATSRSKATFDPGAAQAPPSISPASAAGASEAPGIIATRNDRALLFFDVHGVMLWTREVLEPALPRLLMLESAKEDLKESCVQALREVSTELSSTSSTLRNSVLNQIISQCVAQLAPARAIPALYCMTGRAMPTSPSLFVGELLRPLRTFLTDFDAQLTPHSRQDWSRDTATALSKNYAQLASGMLDTVRKNEDAIRRYGSKKQAIDNGESPPERDSDKVCVQLFLDVEAYGSQLNDLGVSTELLAEYITLVDVVRPDQTLLQRLVQG